MVERADLCRLHSPAARATCGAQMPPAPLRARQDMAPCRTERLGGQMSHCAPCQDSHESDHAWKNRQGPKCQQAQAEQWLEHQPRVLLPVIHVLGTYTLPDALRAVPSSHPQNPVSPSPALLV
jgi:Transposase zinc-binding domain